MSIYDSDTILARARGAIGKKCIYTLGKGGMDPTAEAPWDLALECDCSGFACWCLGISRLQAGKWLGTDAIDFDAEMPGGLFDQVPREEAQPGDVIVFPHRVRGHHGHIGIVGSIGFTGPETAIHCSLGNWTRTNDAIQETNCGVFWLNRAIVARFTPPTAIA